MDDANRDCSYKYVPSLVEDILFPSTTTSPSSSSRPPPKKRRRIDHQEKLDLDVEMEDGTRPSRKNGGEEPWLGKRPVILETAKESYLLSPSTLTSPSEEEGEMKQMYDIALILEAEEEEMVVPVDLPDAERKGGGDGEGRDKIPVSTTASASASVPPLAVLEKNPESKTEQVQTKLPQRQQIEPPLRLRSTVPSPVHSPEPSENENDNDDDVAGADDPVPVVKTFAAPSQFALQVLQRNLTKEMFRFEDDGIYVLDPAGSGMETEWVIQVKSWKWTPGLS